MPTADAIRICLGTEAQRQAATAVIPPAGVHGYCTDSGLEYVADGTTSWASLGVSRTIGVHAARIMSIASLAALDGNSIATDDVLWVWDTSAAAPKKITKANLVGSGGSGGAGALLEAYPNTVVANSASQQTLYDFPLPGGTLTANGQSVVGWAEGVITNDTGSARYIEVTAALDGTPSLQAGTTSFATSANPRWFGVETRFTRVSATSGVASARFLLSNTGSSATMAAGNINGNLTFNVAALGVEVTGLDWAAAVNLRQQLRFTDANANLSLNHRLTRIAR